MFLNKMDKKIQEIKNENDLLERIKMLEEENRKLKEEKEEREEKPIKTESDNNWHLRDKSTKGYFRTWELGVKKNNKDLLMFFNKHEKEIIDKMEREQEDLTNYKFSLVTKIKMEYVTKDTETYTDHF